MIKFITRLLFVLLLCSNSSGISNLFAQSKAANSTHIYKALKKLDVLGSILYIAAHPDDENSSVLAYMDQGELFRAAYLSLTRGDGGQNLLGKEKGALLGVLRTQELLAARRIDGAEQFFTRAIDFGYSKTSDETLQNWDKTLILGDVVKVIRLFKPDIIVTRFSETRGGHGHHLVSAILAREAFLAAADPNRYPGQLTDLQVWQAKRIFWNTWSPSQDAVNIDIGKFDPLLGKSYQELSAESRTMHKSQGFGVSPKRGEQKIWFDLTAGEPVQEDLFEGIDITWNRLEDSEPISHKVDELIYTFNPNRPGKSVKGLVELYNLLDKYQENYWIDIKKSEVKELIQMCSGLWIESIVDNSGASPGMILNVKPMILKRSDVPVTLKRIGTTFQETDTIFSNNLKENIPYSFISKISIPDDAEFTQPFWLRLPNDGKMFSFTESDLIYRAESPPPLKTFFVIEVYGQTFKYKVPVLNRWNDAIHGEQYRPFIIRPGLSLSIDKPTYIFAGNKSHNIDIQISASDQGIEGSLQLEIPEGWNIEPKQISFNLKSPGDQLNTHFQVSPTKNAKSGAARLIATTVDARSFHQKLITIKYDHIPPQTVLQPAEAHLVKLNITVPPGKIGYIMGSGDEIPEALSQLGYDIHLLSDNDLEHSDLSVYNVIICGVRAFNTRTKLSHQQKRLITYVENGGTWIVQHNTRFGFDVGQIGPYPFSTSGRDRIADETAPLKILNPDHQLFNYPNKITSEDFDHWVQERGLYFADSWDSNFQVLLSGNDAGENPKRGGLLFARYGKGVFIFTGYSWFRQLPAGVPGAYRLFVNMISAKGDK